MRLALAALLSLAVLGACRAAPEEPDAQPAPEFSLETLEGTVIALAELRGRPVIVDFWATWCVPCVYQIPVLNAFYEAHRDDGLVVLGVSVDRVGRDEIGAFAAEQDIRYPVLLGDEELAQRYGAIGFPSLYVIRPDGTIHEAHVGIVSEEALETALAAVRRF